MNLKINKILNVLLIFFCLISLLLTLLALIIPSDIQSNEKKLITEQLNIDGDFTKVIEYLKKSLVNPESYKRISTNYKYTENKDIIIKHNFSFTNETNIEIKCSVIAIMRKGKIIGFRNLNRYWE